MFIHRQPNNIDRMVAKPANGLSVSETRER